MSVSTQKMRFPTMCALCLIALADFCLWRSFQLAADHDLIAFAPGILGVCALLAAVGLARSCWAYGAQGCGFISGVLAAFVGLITGTPAGESAAFPLAYASLLLGLAYVYLVYAWSKVEVSHRTGSKGTMS